MLTFVKDNIELQNQIRTLFIWFFEKTNKIWRDYNDKISEASLEDAKQLKQKVIEERKKLIKKGIDSFPDKKYIELIETLLNALDEDSERAENFYTEPNYYLKSIDTHLDCFSTIGAHGFIDTIIFDSVEDTSKDTILRKYKSFLDKQFKALLEYENPHEIIWDNVYFINLNNNPRLFPFKELIEHKNEEC